ncbi:MAG: GAF domain-containing protein, partial [Burkholderiales bacterium]|nr:GAF domain-containing protein [Burkholderiales bacterium]
MNITAERELAHAGVLRARGLRPASEKPPPEILDSWARCLQAGLDFAAPVAPPVVDGADLARRRDRTAVLRRLARAELQTLAQQITGSNFLLAFADAEGVILDLYADNRFAMSATEAGIVAGSCWAESVCGTNGLGTALASGRPLAVCGPEHYLLRLGEVACTAAPVRDALGEIVGVIDASSHFESRQHHTRALVQMAATHVENGLLMQQMSQRMVLAIHPRPEFLGTLSVGLLAFDDEGRLEAANARARQLLQGLRAEPGVDFDTLFCEPYEQVAARLRSGAEIRLRDGLGGGLVARCIAWPAAPAPRAMPAPEAARTA